MPNNKGKYIVASKYSQVLDSKKEARAYIRKMAKEAEYSGKMEFYICKIKATASAKGEGP